MTHQLVKERERAMQAKQVLENPMFQESVEKLTLMYRGQMENPDMYVEDVMNARQKLLALKRIVKELEIVMQTGKLAEKQQEEERGR